MKSKEQIALIAVDVQHDFMPGGALAVADGDQVVQPLLAAADQSQLMIASRDWHPDDHCSFHEQGGPWPVHCVAHTYGAALDPLIEERADKIISKADTSAVDAYSAFQGTDLTEYLRTHRVTHLLIGGLATDYCVKATVLDAIAAGFSVTVLLDASRAVNAEPGDEAQAIKEMSEAGAAFHVDFGVSA